jgi:hypothetical protein
MSKTNATVRWLTTAMLAASLVACGTVQGATPDRAGTQIEAPRGDVHLTEFDANDTHAAPVQDGGNAAGDTNSGPALVP